MALFLPPSIDADGALVEPDIRQTVRDNTTAIDLGFPTLEFYNNKSKGQEPHFMPGTPLPFPLFPRALPPSRNSPFTCAPPWLPKDPTH